jgi:hypothetical protein
MADERDRAGLERLMKELAESVLKLSEDVILAESSEAGANFQQEAERTRSVLRQAAQRFQSLSRRLSDLGHTFNPKSWRSEGRVYQNRCLNCGSIVTFAAAADEVRSPALDTRCRAKDYPAMTQTGSGS